MMWRFWGDVFMFLQLSRRYQVFVARLILPSNPKYHYPKARNDNACKSDV